MMNKNLITVIIFVLFVTSCHVSALNLMMMAGRRGKGNLKRSLGLAPETVKKSSSNSVRSLNQGKGQEITGVTLPAEGKVKGWEFGSKQRIACANVGGNFYAIQGNCPRCAFDLFKGQIVTDEAFEDLPRLACMTCGTTYSLRTGKHGPELKLKGFTGFIGGLAKTATVNDANTDAKAFVITRDVESGQVFCKDR